MVLKFSGNLIPLGRLLHQADVYSNPIFPLSCRNMCSVVLHIFCDKFIFAVCIQDVVCYIEWWWQCVWSLWKILLLNIKKNLNWNPGKMLQDLFYRKKGSPDTAFVYKLLQGYRNFYLYFILLRINTASFEWNKMWIGNENFFSSMMKKIVLYICHTKFIFEVCVQTISCSLLCKLIMEGMKCFWIMMKM